MKALLTPREFAEAIGVSESSVKRWVDDGHILATRTAGGHRRISLQEASRYIREQGTPLIRPDLLGLPELRRVGSNAAAPDDLEDRLFESLRTGSAAEARGLILSRYLGGSSVAKIVDGLLARAMTKIGELWVSDPAGILWEHRATQIAIQAVAQLRLLLNPLEDSATAIGGAPVGDRYILPSLTVAAVLEGQGLRVVNLGPETPMQTLVRGIEDVNPRLVWLSVSVATNVDMLRRDVQELGQQLLERGSLLVIGGAEASKLSLPESEAVYVGRSMAELEALVQGMRLFTRSPPENNRPAPAG